MKYLVTGGNGFLGRHLCRFLEEHGIEFLATVRQNPGARQVATGDLVEFKDWSKLLHGIDIVIHSAAKAHDMSGSTDLPAAYLKFNFELTKEIADQAKLAGVKKFIFISTVKVNGERNSEKHFSPDDMPAPEDDYGKSKLLAENYLLSLHQPSQFEVTIIRPCLIYGKGVKANFKSLIGLLEKNIPLPFGSVKNKRSFVSVDNVCDFILTCSVNSKSSGQIFLVSDGQDLSLPELIQTLARSMGKNVIMLPIPVWFLKFLLFATGKGNISKRLFSNLQVDISKNKNVMNWTPPFKVDSEIKKMLQNSV